MEVRQFSELNENEIADLDRTLKERAKAEGCDLLEDVVCAFRPLEGCDCGCNK